MSIQVVIRDGSPYWYLSPDIWVVPGSDPSGAPGSPIAGQLAYLWARVGNTGSTDANAVRIDFYWANPALQVTRSNATLVGSAYADVPAGGTQDALCLVPWMPVVVNGGHECLVAVATHPGNPLPNPLPDAFDPPTYPQVAQKNLSVLEAAVQPAMLILTVNGLQRGDKIVVLTAEIGGELDAASLDKLGLHDFRPILKPVVEVGLDRERRCAGERDSIGEGKLEVRVPRGTSAAVHLTVRAGGLHEREYQLVQIVERQNEKIIGGLGVIVVSAKPDRKEKQS